MGRIVIADDAAIMRSQLSAIFERRGDTVVAEAENGQDAVAAFERYKPDLMTMDINMPVLTGIEAVRNIREKFPVDNIVMISTENERSMLMQAFRSGVKYYILKPFAEEKVLSVAEQILGSNPAAEQTGASPMPRPGSKAKPVRQPVWAPKEMPSEHTTFVNEYLVGKTVGENIFNSGGKLLLREGYIVTDAVVDLLKKNNVRYIKIK
ncbi:response regulator transcription factor [Gordoniibacillus kamchatkensis]|uniref:response regulator transcription factor n=1 Tax=Gordoniibacillus kamchatkensis TaxID=1590651 RepID=UPI000695C4E6|nr:response regulator [Paenibacillus sp. VKM B-2647]